MAVEPNRQALWAFARAITERLSGTLTNNYIRVYQGTMPSDANSYTEAGYSGDLLATFNDFSLIQSINIPAYVSFDQAPDPSTVNASATGTAAWFSLYPSTNPERVLVGDVTDETGNGSLRLDSVNLTSGNPVTIITVGMIFE